MQASTSAVTGAVTVTSAPTVASTVAAMAQDLAKFAEAFEDVEARGRSKELLERLQAKIQRGDSLSWLDIRPYYDEHAKLVGKMEQQELRDLFKAIAPIGTLAEGVTIESLAGVTPLKMVALLKLAVACIPESLNGDLRAARTSALFHELGTLKPGIYTQQELQDLKDGIEPPSLGSIINPTLFTYM